MQGERAGGGCLYGWTRTSGGFHRVLWRVTKMPTKRSASAVGGLRRNKGMDSQCTHVLPVPGATSSTSTFKASNSSMTASGYRSMASTRLRTASWRVQEGVAVSPSAACLLSSPPASLWPPRWLPVDTRKRANAVEKEMLGSSRRDRPVANVASDNDNTKEKSRQRRA